MKSWLVFLLILTAVQLVLLQNIKIRDDAYLTAPQLISKYGYKPELHEVHTRDGYVLTLHRVRTKKKDCKYSKNTPVLVMHGILNSSTDFLILGPKHSLGYLLADACYDTWLGNSRGNFYSRKHSNMTGEELAFWDFSWHEFGETDLPQLIDYVLKTTEHKSLYYVGHSQGATQFFVYASLHPKHHEKKVKSMFAMAPAVFLGNMKTPARSVVPLAKQIMDVANELKTYEIFANTDLVKSLAKTFCTNERTKSLCSYIFFVLCGFNPNLFDYDILPTLLHHTPAGSSLKQFAHYAQLVTNGGFRQYDYGKRENMKRYNQLKPPKYPLERVNIPVYIFYGENDWVTTPADTVKLSHKLSANKTKLFRVDHKRFNHVDFVYAKGVEDYVNMKILEILKKDHIG